MENLANLKFRGSRWDTSSEKVEGSLSVRDRETLQPADKNTNRNGYILCIETEQGWYQVVPDSVTLIQ